jgi:alginate O-acetyltransferase complex protein AlgI
LLVLVGVLALLALPVYWGPLPARWRPLAFCLLGWAALACYEPRSLLLLAALTVATHALSLRGASSWRRAGLASALVVAVLVAQKLLALRGVVLVGFSYACFRLIHAALDHAAGRLGSPGLLGFLEYALFPAYFLSGPIARHQEHTAGTSLDALGLDDALAAMGRVLLGLAKKVLLASPLLRLADAGFGDPGGASLAWAGLLAYSLGLYVDFSGYTDVALGVARLFGFRGPENFDWPYLASDIGEFWRRWHITLSNWLRDYLYLPLSSRLSTVNWFRQRPLALASASSLVTMALCGLWHGLAPSFLVWGLGHGGLIALHQLYRQRLLSRLPARRRRALLASRAYLWACTALTFTAVTLLWTFFRLPPAAALRFLGRLAGL